MPPVASTGERMVVGCRRQDRGGSELSRDAHDTEIYWNLSPWRTGLDQEVDEGNRPSAQCEHSCVMCARNGRERVCTFSRGHPDTHACHVCAFTVTSLATCDDVSFWPLDPMSMTFQNLTKETHATGKVMFELTESGRRLAEEWNLALRGELLHELQRHGETVRPSGQGIL